PWGSGKKRIDVIPGFHALLLRHFVICILNPLPCLDDAVFKSGGSVQSWTDLTADEKYNLFNYLYLKHWIDSRFIWRVSHLTINMTEEDQDQAVEALFRAMKSWDRDRMREWINEVLGSDEDMKPVIEELYRQKEIDNDQLIEIFKGILTTGLEDKSETVSTDEVTGKEADPKEVKEKEALIPKKSPASTSSASSEIFIKRRKKTRKLAILDSSDAESDCKVLSSKKKRNAKEMNSFKTPSSKNSHPVNSILNPPNKRRKKVSRTKRRPGPKVGFKNDPIYLDPEYLGYRRKFRLRPVTVVLYDIKKQSPPWQSGDKVYRAQPAKNIPNRKEKRRPEVKKEKYSKFGTRILPFERRPENAELFKKKKRVFPCDRTKDDKAKVDALARKTSLVSRNRPVTKNPKKIIKAHKNIQNVPKKYEELKWLYPPIKLGDSVSYVSPLAPVARVSMHFDKERPAISEKESIVLPVKRLEVPPPVKQLKSVPPPAPRVALKEKVVEIDLTHDDQLDKCSVPDRQSVVRQNCKYTPERNYSNVNQKNSMSLVSEGNFNDSLARPSFLGASTDILPPQPNSDAVELAVSKCIEWLRSNDLEPFFQTSPSIPEQDEENMYTLMTSTITKDYDYDLSFRCSQSNQDNEENEEEFPHDVDMRYALDPDIVDEYCGARVLTFQLRVKAGKGDGCFKDVFHVPRGCNYDKYNFKAKCNLCEESITDQRCLGTHIRSKSHRANMANTSLKLIGVKSKPDSSEEILSPVVEVINNKTDSLNKTSGSSNINLEDNVMEKTLSVGQDCNVAKKKEEIKKLQSRSRSPCRRRRQSHGSRRWRRPSRSNPRSRPYRRSNSRSCIKGRDRRSRSKSRAQGRQQCFENKVQQGFERAQRGNLPQKPGPGNKICLQLLKGNADVVGEKLLLQEAGKWTPELEARWKLWEVDQEKLENRLNERKMLLEEKPEDHPKYNAEWFVFWGKRAQELVNLGKNPETYDYIPEWKVNWSKIIDRILSEELAKEAQALRLKHGMDMQTLNALKFSNPPPPPFATPTQPMVVPGVGCRVPFQSPFISGQVVPCQVPLNLNYPTPPPVPVQQPRMGWFMAPPFTYQSK
ncbi:unnamed protein product, partial [Allacma fusca]